MKYITVIMLIVLLSSTKSMADSPLSSGGYQQVFIEFSQPSLVEMVSAYYKQHGVRPSPEEQKAYTQLLKNHQKRLIELVADFDTRHIKSFTTTLNGMKCLVQPDDLQKIKALDGVKGVRSVTQFKRYQDTSAPSDVLNSDYLKAIGVDKLHEQGYTGKGQVIAIIDSGVNYFLKGLGGTVDPADRASIVNDESVIEEGTFPNDKVIGGIDLAGNVFTDGTSVSDPDPSESGILHGTYVAAFAAGSAGNDFAPGVAPDAKILAIKVSGPGSSGLTLTADAIDFALDPNQDGSIDDHADVINISLGIVFGAVLGRSVEEIAVERAAMLGVIVVAAAANEGQNQFNISVPAAWPSVIGVGNTRFEQNDSGQFSFSPFVTTSAGPHPITAAFKPDLMAPGANLPVLGIASISGTSFSSPIVAGLAAVLRQKYPHFSIEQIKSLMANSTRRVHRSFDASADYSPLHIQGVGVIQAQDALALTSIATPSTLSFGVLEVERNDVFTQEITVTNTSDHAKEYHAVVEPNTTYKGLRYDVTPRFTIPAHSQKTITFRMRVNPKILSESVTALSNVDGWVVITEGNETLSSGYFGMVRASSNIQLKDFNSGSVVSNRSEVDGVAKRYLAAEYAQVTVLDEATDIQKTVPQLGVAINQQDDQYILELLVAFDSPSILPFGDGRRPITIRADFTSQTGSASEFITIGDVGILHTYTSLRGAFSQSFDLDNQRFFNSLRVFNTQTIITGALFNRRADHITVEMPTHSRYMLVGIPLDHKPEGEMTLNTTVSSRKHSREPFDFEAQSALVFDQTDFPSYSGTKGRIAKVKNNNTALNKLWLFPQNTSQASIAIERAASLLPEVATVQPIIHVDSTLLPGEVSQNTLAALAVNVQSTVDVRTNVILRSTDPRFVFSQDSVELATDRSRPLRFSLDTTSLPVGEVFSAVVDIVRIEDNHVLYQVPVALNITPLIPNIFIDVFSSQGFNSVKGNSIDIGDVTVNQLTEFSAFVELPNLSDTLLPLTVKTGIDNPDFDIQFAESSVGAIDLFWVYTPTTLGRFTASLLIDLGSPLSTVSITITGNVIGNNE